MIIKKPIKGIENILVHCNLDGTINMVYISYESPIFFKREEIQAIWGSDCKKVPPNPSEFYQKEKHERYSYTLFSVDEMFVFLYEIDKEDLLHSLRYTRSKQ